MRIPLDDGRKFEAIFMAMASEAVLPPKNDMEGKQKLSVDGKPLFNARALACVRMVDGAPQGVDDSITLSLIEQPAGGITFGKVYRLSGPTLITPYVQNNNRLGMSIVAQSITPVAQGGENK